MYIYIYKSKLKNSDTTLLVPPNQDSSVSFIFQSKSHLFTPLTTLLTSRNRSIIENNPWIKYKKKKKKERQKKRVTPTKMLFKPPAHKEQTKVYTSPPSFCIMRLHSWERDGNGGRRTHIIFPYRSSADFEPH